MKLPPFRKIAVSAVKVALAFFAFVYLFNVYMNLRPCEPVEDLPLDLSSVNTIALFALAEGTRLRVIAHRPDYIGPAQDEAHIGQNLLYWFFRPVGAAVRSTAIGQAMLEVTVRGRQFRNGSKLGTRSIQRYSHTYRERAGR